MARRTRRKKRRPGIAVLPSLLTLGNGLCGFGAITIAAKFQAGAPVEAAATHMHYLMVAGWLILAGMVFDAVDGRVARMAKVTTDFGEQLDSLCDLITFGVAPAFLLTKLSGAMPGKPLWVIAALFMACAALRLARFNVETSPEADAHKSFRGLPSPAAGGAIAVVAIMQEALLSGTYCSVDLGRSINDIILVVLPYATVGLAVLMVSPLRYPHVASHLFGGRKSFNHLVEVLMAIVFLVLVRELGLAALTWAYVIGGGVAGGLSLVRSKPTALPSPASAEDTAT